MAAEDEVETLRCRVAEHQRSNIVPPCHDTRLDILLPRLQLHATSGARIVNVHCHGIRQRLRPCQRAVGVRQTRVVILSEARLHADLLTIPVPERLAASCSIRRPALLLRLPPGEVCLLVSDGNHHFLPAAVFYLVYAHILLRFIVYTFSVSILSKRIVS